MLNPALSDKLNRLRLIFNEAAKVLVAYSGGIDSTLVAKVAFDVLGDRALAITANSPSLLPADLAAAKVQAEFIGIKHQIVQTDEMNNPNYTSNPINRCYFCKSELHDTLKPLAKTMGYGYVVDGLNADDLQDYRPGIQAAKERGVRSPLAEVGISKIEVRMLSQYLEMPWWDKPSQPCLSSRFPYGEEITIEKLRRVGNAEQYLRDIGWKGDIRVRSMGNTAKIEVSSDRLGEFINNIDMSQFTQALRDYGFSSITLDLEGFRSGKLNDAIHQLK
ncbi:MAG: ATP-dependent sacrificial sulfur transferase LarE [Pseudanabaena sp. M57BS1SP1A06MG]|uniref:ATP-dependent sacrificial sulfur transferase LarE n=1 Tax=Pseudanabaena mucicola TaxID=71190 RepID=UPI002577470B|nr:ATP-dependent sacrificial sulfur transferase LarE [Pseudanabaena mucicola]MCA6574079.1 ATP-dependent sacrificial sulfur transferase LarE [Pseudanabaena sp. M53BS1SP1A06MG]MCA6583803.1 ATP-dependent sacrificial sulfur transferase LarE [Pseudanabaena sp. M34BS1SP1A06MG]MCA6591879.1 ATP-dependent sacrificial sulfur transferase LarE [Pseudanabaena sp. M38BS1SP1A06MG]MCA6599296.1 ATP-dependent sacrificial sulfur transferase LarE [Pseudanabaena sp. M57BS1SP1A06MG]